MLIVVIGNKWTFHRFLRKSAPISKLSLVTPASWIFNRMLSLLLHLKLFHSNIVTVQTHIKPCNQSLAVLSGRKTLQNLCVFLTVLQWRGRVQNCFNLSLLHTWCFPIAKSKSYYYWLDCIEMLCKFTHCCC